MPYFDNAATTFPKPVEVLDRIYEIMKSIAANPGRTGHKMACDAEHVIIRCRNLISKFFGLSSSDNVIFTLNATDALNIAIKGILREGDHVITSDFEHNSVMRPLNQLMMDEVIELDYVKPGEDGIIGIEDIKNMIKSNTKMIVITHSSNVFGVMQPVQSIAKLAHENNVLFLLDAAQTAGIIKIDMQKDEIDLLAVPGHKSLFAPMGTGVLCVNTEQEISPFREGGTGRDSESPTHPKGLPTQLEAGTPNLPGIGGLLEGIEFINRIGLENIAGHKAQLTNYFISGLENIPEYKIDFKDSITPECGTVSFQFINNDITPHEVSSILSENYDIACRAGLHCAPCAHKFNNTYPNGTIRVSFGYFNTKEEVDLLINALKEIAAEFNI